MTGYYNIFVQSYGVIRKPLTNILKKNAFYWHGKAEVAFNKLKEAMTTAPVLDLANFHKPFSVETDACSKGIGVVLMQEGRPLAFFILALGPKNLGRSTYEKEYLVVLLVVERWKHYLQGGHFIIRTDHQIVDRRKHYLEGGHLLLEQII